MYLHFFILHTLCCWFVFFEINKVEIRAVCVDQTGDNGGDDSAWTVRSLRLPDRTVRVL